jgi:hypothetical protein
MAFLRQAGIPVPKPFLSAAEFSLNVDIKRALKEEKTDEDRIRSGLDEMKKWNLPPDSVGIEFMLRRRLEGMMADLVMMPSDMGLLAALISLLELLKTMPFEVNLWQAQNGYFRIAKTVYRDFLSKARSGDDAAGSWLEAFRSVGEALSFSLPSVLPEG